MSHVEDTVLTIKSQGSSQTAVMLNHMSLWSDVFYMGSLSALDPILCKVGLKLLYLEKGAFNIQDWLWWTPESSTA